MQRNETLDMSHRRYISWKTKYAAALLKLGDVPYLDAKLMSEDQIISLYHIDHNILHSSEHEDRDRYWNLEPKLIQAHRTKTKADAKVVAKSKRIRADWVKLVETSGVTREPALLRKIRSRGFDKSLRRKLDGTVERK
jgi:hypothetical protein